MDSNLGVYPLVLIDLFSWHIIYEFEFRSLSRPISHLHIFVALVRVGIF